MRVYKLTPPIFMAATPEKHFVPESNTIIVEDETLRGGFVQLPKLVLHASNLSRDAKLLYGVLLSYAWQEGSCFPGYSRLCEDMQATEKVVRKYMRELQDRRLLSQRRRGLGKTNVYTLHDLRKANIVVPDRSKSTVPEQSKTPVQEQSQSPVAERYKLPSNNKQSNNKQNNNKQHHDVVVALKKYGIADKVATALAENHPRDYILEKIRLMLWYVKNDVRKIGKNPPGFLRRAIEDDYELPPELKGVSTNQALFQVLDAEKELGQLESVDSMGEDRRQAE